MNPPVHRASMVVLVLVLAACSGPASPPGSATATGQPDLFQEVASGTLRISGFNPSDEVGKSRQHYADTSGLKS